MSVLFFCEREADLARMSVVLLEDGRLVARRRTGEDALASGSVPPETGSLWIHVASNGRYALHPGTILDEDTGLECHAYTALADGRCWLRPVAEWDAAQPHGRRRFEPL